MYCLFFQVKSESRGSIVLERQTFPLFCGLKSIRDFPSMCKSHWMTHAGLYDQKVHQNTIDLYFQYAAVLLTNCVSFA